MILYYFGIKSLHKVLLLFEKTYFPVLFAFVAVSSTLLHLSNLIPPLFVKGRRSE